MRRFAAILCRQEAVLFLAIALFLSAIAPVGALPASCTFDGNHHAVETVENFAADRSDHVDSTYGAPLDYCCLVVCSPCKALAFAGIDAAHISNETALLFAANDPASGTGAAPSLRPPQA